MQECFCLHSSCEGLALFKLLREVLNFFSVRLIVVSFNSLLQLAVTKAAVQLCWCTPQSQAFEICGYLLLCCCTSCQQVRDDKSLNPRERGVSEINFIKYKTYVGPASLKSILSLWQQRQACDKIVRISLKKDLNTENVTFQGSIIFHPQAGRQPLWLVKLHQLMH